MKMNVTECPYCDKEFIEPDEKLYEYCPRCGHLIGEADNRLNLPNVCRTFEIHE